MGRLPTDTKEKLIETAADLIWQHSYGSVSVDDICEAAGVKKGSFYHYFPSKVDLAMAVMEDFYQKSKPVFDNIFSENNHPLKRFEMMADHMIDRQQEACEKYGFVCGCPMTTLGSEMAGQEEHIRAKVDEIFMRFEKYCIKALEDLCEEGLLPPDTDIKAKSEEIYTYLMGQKVMARIHNSLEGLKRDLKPGLLRVIDINPVQKDITK